MSKCATCLGLLVALVLTVAAGAQAPLPDERTLLLDHLDETFTPDGKLQTRPARITRTGDATGGLPTGGKFVPGKFGNALEMHGLMQMTYPSSGNINLGAGRADFWVALNFDAEEKVKNPGPLSNQMFLTIWGGGARMVSVYSCLNTTCLGVWDKNRQLVAYTNIPGFWKKGEWHHVQVSWGRALRLRVDEQEAVINDWAGLFGPLDVKPEDLRLSFGSFIGLSAVESEYALDEVRIEGPGGDQTTDYPIMTVCRMKAPTIDGKLGHLEWDGAAQTTGFVCLNDDVLADEQTNLYAGWDDEALYLAYECLNPTKCELTARLTERDTAVYMEDAVDFICRPNPAAFPYYHFICNAIGTVYDSTMDPTRPTPGDLSYNPSCVFKTSREADRWVVECKIPFSALSGRPAPQDGERWRVNFCRDGETINRYSSWSYAAGNFHEPDNFGELVFSTSDRAIRLGPLSDLTLGKVETQALLTGFLFDPLVTVKTRLIGEDAKPLAEMANRLADYRAVTIKAPPLVTGKYVLTVNASTAAGPMYYQRLPFRVMKAYDITVEGYPYEGKLWITANVNGVPNPPPGLTARSRLMQGDTVIAECSTDSFPAGLGAASIPIATLPPGKYLVKSDALAPDGTVLASAEAEFEQFARPSWWHNAIGIDHSVPNPWTPIKATATKLSVLGREYQGTGSLPSQVLNQGQTMLAAPITFNLGAGGKTMNLANLKPVESQRFPDLVQRTSLCTVDTVSAKLVATTEFDGLQRYDLTLTSRGTAEVSNLILQIPLKSQYATFLCPSNGSTSPSLVLPKEGWKSTFMPQVWVGNDDLGFAFCAESDEFWRPNDSQMVEVLPEGARTILRCNMIRQPLKLDKPITITFGLMATPVKDAHAGDPFWFRFGEGEGQQQCQESCRYPGLGNVDLKQGTMECWLAPLGEMTGSWRILMSLVAGDGRNMMVYYRPTPEQELNVLVESDGKQISGGARGLQLKSGEFAHIAVTWSDKVRLFCNGKLLATLDTTLPTEWPTDPAKFSLRLGCLRDWSGYCKEAIDEFRVSSSVRYAGDTYTVPTSPFVKDDQTLLLDHFDTSFRPDGEDAETSATVISGKSGELGGVPSLGCRFIPGKFGSALDISVWDPMTRQAAVKRWGINARSHWFWLEEDGTKYGWPSPLMTEPEIPNLRATLKEDTALGLRPSTYAVYPALGSPSPLSAQFWYEWGRLPLSTQPSEPPKGHYFWDVCPRSGWSDYVAAGSQWLLDDVGMYGLYTDGAAQAYACKNTHHGCGWIDDKGQVHPTWPVFAAREMLKRMYRLIHARHADGYLVNHMSFNTLIPSMSFTDVMYSGEHEQYENMTRFRVRWQGKQWGFWTILLAGMPISTSHCTTHGVSCTASRSGRKAGWGAMIWLAKPPTCGWPMMRSATGKPSGSPTSAPGSWPCRILTK